ncbi:MAG TPA: Gfo/Idh/MocA family oxidoreductase [Pyrinomonadaceae bacterium]|jgi:predicted dehydrogenase
MIRLALLGCGEHSRSSHASPLARYSEQHTDEIMLVAACDLNVARAKAFCQEFGFARAYTDVETMLAKETIDGCISVMPMHQIVDFGVMLLERKIPCVIEKPLGISLAEAERLARVALETGTPHMVSVNRRFMPYLNEALTWARKIGPLQYVRATQVRNKRDESDFIWSTAIHVLDALRYVAGEVSDFTTEVLQQSGLSANWYIISLRFESGTRGRIEVLPTAGMIEESYELLGDGFHARVVAGSGEQRSLQCWRDGQLEVEKHSSDLEPEDLRNGSYEEVVEFVRALRAGTHPRPSVADILPSARICFAIAESTARQVKVSW